MRGKLTTHVKHLLLYNSDIYKEDLKECYSERF